MYIEKSCIAFFWSAECHIHACMLSVMGEGGGKGGKEGGGRGKKVREKVREG